MNNILYTICDNNYKHVLELWLKSFSKYKDYDILIICPEDFNIQHDIKTYKVKNFDYRYTAKFLIFEYENIKNYENILYLDLDIVCQKSISSIFEIIESNKNIIHGVKEKESLKNSDHFHRFDNNYDSEIQDDYIAFNAGTFGFNINMIDIFKEYLQYTNHHKDKLCDQPIFNMFFNSRKLIISSLSNYVYLDGYIINEKCVDDYPMIHFLGCYGNAYHKISKLKNYV